MSHQGSDPSAPPLNTDPPVNTDHVSPTSSPRSSQESAQSNRANIPAPLKLKTSGTGIEHSTKQGPSNLSFFDRYFKIPVAPPDDAKSSTKLDSPSDKDRPPPSPSYKPEHRRFSFKSMGSVISIIALASTLLVITATLLGYFLSRRKSSPPWALTPASIDDTAVAFGYSKPPIRLALLTNFPDPTIRHDASSGIWYAVGTNYDAGINAEKPDDAHPVLNNGFNLQLATSKDFSTWTLATHDILPEAGAWTRNGTTSGPLPGRVLDLTSGDRNGTRKEYSKANVWAPELLHHPTSGQWILYYAAASDQKGVPVNSTSKKHHRGGSHCIGVATSSSPTGVFTPSELPIICPISDGGAIDPAVFVDGDTNEIWLAYKEDGNSLGHGGECGNTKEPIHATPIMLQKMSSDGLSINSTYQAKQIMNRQADDGPLVEGPSLIKTGDTFYLFFSSGCTRSPSYNIKYATASSIEGPYVRASEPLLKTGDNDLLAPGSVSVTWQMQSPATTTNSTQDQSSATDQAAGNMAGQWKMALHGRVQQEEGGVRAMFTTGLTFNGDKSITLVNGVPDQS